MTENTPEKTLGKGMLTVGWIIILILLSLYFTKWQEKRINPNQMPETSKAKGVNELVLRRNYQHHYVVSGTINGHNVTFLVDTGATHVSVPRHMADELGLRVGAPGIAMTANGKVETRDTEIDRLEMGSIALRNVRASLNPGMKGDEILLGMSALKNVEFTHRDGTLTLRQYY